MEVLSGAAAVVLVGWLMFVILRHWRQVMIGRLVSGGIDEGSSAGGGNSYEGVLYGNHPSYDSHHGDDGGSNGEDSGGDSGGDGGGDGGGD